jgi:hypothetical protein
MWMIAEQAPSYSQTSVKGTSYSGLRSMAVRYFHTWLFFSKVVEKKEENAVINKNRVALSINPILIH